MALLHWPAQIRKRENRVYLLMGGLAMGLDAGVCKQELEGGTAVTCSASALASDLVSLATWVF